jgi:hypothetical protein
MQGECCSRVTLALTSHTLNIARQNWNKLRPQGFQKFSAVKGSFSGGESLLHTKFSAVTDSSQGCTPNNHSSDEQAETREVKSLAQDYPAGIRAGIQTQAVQRLNLQLLSSAAARTRTSSRRKRRGGMATGPLIHSQLTLGSPVH